MSCLAIIPARAGSKGIPGKNIRSLSGIPLIAHTIQVLQKANHITRVIVSTNGDDIAAIALEYGAEIIKRPTAIAGDLDSSESAVLHVLTELEKSEDLPSHICFAQCTSPLTAAEDFDKGVKMMESGDFDSIFSASSSHSFLWKTNETGQAVGINHDEKKPRLMRQEREAEYLESGAFYIFDTLKFQEEKNRFFGRIGICEIPSSRVFELDTEDDFKRAELLLKKDMS